MGLMLTGAPAHAQDVVVNDAPDGFSPCDGGEDATRIQAGVNAASTGQTIFVCPGTYPETVTVDVSVTLEGNNAGTAGYAARSAETTVDAGSGSFTDAAFTVQADDVTIDGFRLLGSQGVEADGSAAVGAIIQNNLVETNIRGVRVHNLTTTATKSFAITRNQFAIQQQLFDEDGSGTAGDATGEETSSIEVRNVDGPSDGARPTIQENVIATDGDDDSGGGTNDGSFYGYEIDGIDIASGPTAIAGDPKNTGTAGSIQGTAQAIAVLDGQSSPQSNVVLEDFSISMMSGSAPNNGSVNFQAGIFTYAASDNGGNTAVVIRNVTVEGLDFSDPGGNAGAAASANIYLSNFGGLSSPTQTVTIEGVTVSNTEHRGIALAGGRSQNIDATITDDAAGDNTVIQGVAEGTDAHALHTEDGGSPTVNNTHITNANVAAAEALHLRDAPTVTIGPDVTIDANGAVTFGDNGSTIAAVNVTAPTSVPEVNVNVGGTLSLAGSAPLRVTDRLALSSGTFDVSSGALTLASSGNASTAYVSGTGSGSLTGAVTVEWRVPSGYTGFQALTAPVSAPLDGTSDALLSNMWTQKSGTGTGYNAANGGVSRNSVFDYDETAAVGGSVTDSLDNAWFAPSDISTPITQGQTGRLVYFFNDRDFDEDNDASSPFTLSATGTLLTEENTNADVDLGLTYTKNDGGGDADGWNLVGNPFMAPIDWERITGNGQGRTRTSRTVYIPKADGTYATYQADKNGRTDGASTNGGSRYLSPFQGFFVKATGNSPSLTVKSDDKALAESPPLKRGGAAPPTVKLHMRTDGASEAEDTVVRFSDDATFGASDGDAYQLVPIYGDYFYIASEIPDSSSAYEIQSLPRSEAKTQTVPLHLASATARTYTLSGTLRGVPDDWTVRLRNQQTGATANLTRGESLAVDVGSDQKSLARPPASKASPRLHLQTPLVAPASPTPAPDKAASDAARVVLEVTRPDRLPVELAEFDGHVRAPGAIELTWTTASETNNAGFRVQRSPSGDSPWRTLGFVEGSGTTSSTRTYRFTDDTLPYEASTFTYRLKQVDRDGTVRYSTPISVARTAPSTLRIRSVFPNPARSDVTVRYEIPRKTEVTIALYDVLGRRVATGLNRSQDAGRTQTTISVSGLSSGVYFVRLRTESAVTTRKLVVAE
jgi:hypothetical protein